VGLLCTTSQKVGNLMEGVAQRFCEQIFLAPEVFVEAAVGEASVAHDCRNGGAIDAFGADPPGSVFHDLVMDFGFVFRAVAHGSL